MLKIYGSDPSSPANKVRFVANYLNIPYEYTVVKLREGEHRKEWFLKLNPVGKIPVMDDNGFVLFESGAIIKYLAAREKSDIYPTDIKQRAVIDQWSEFVINHILLGMSKIAFNTIFYKIVGTEKDERSLKDGLDFLARFLPIVDQQLSKNKYLAGDKISIADFSLIASLDPCEVCEIDLSKYKNIVKYRNELRQKDFYTKCFKEYGEFLKQPAAK